MTRFHIFQLALITTTLHRWRKQTQLISLKEHKLPWQNMLKPWLALWIKAPKSLTTEIQFAMKLAKEALVAHSHFQGLCPPIFGHFSAKAKGHSAGSHSLETQKIFTAQIRQFLTYFRRIKSCTAGSLWPKRKWLSKVCLLVSVGSVMANAKKLV